MDNKKDIEKIKDDGGEVSSQREDLNAIDFFQKDESFVFVYKKTEKIATALYMITNLFTDSEPMKWTLRTKVSQLLSFIIGFKDILQSREDEFINETKTRVLEIVSLLEISSRSGLVSPMNFSILKSEFIYLTQYLSHFKKSSAHGYPNDIKENFFEIQNNNQSNKRGYIASDLVTKNDTTKTNNVLNTYKKTNRQNIIIDLIKKKKDLTINDIALVISDCSEKTIQRELILLISGGVVKKIGQRRWSRYSLV